ncbi:MAG: ABC transporter permease [Nitrospira sp.]|nr:ABC transporter permease [Nitrospira sp.]MCP9443184.1 ABC transporter permease [Nitrospira sp.]
MMTRFAFLTVFNSVRVLQQNRLQASLTMLGIMVGVGAVIMIIGIGQGARFTVQAQIASMGTNVILILPGATTVGGVRTGLGGKATLTAADAREIKSQVPRLREVAWIKRKGLQVAHGARNWRVNVYGASPGFFSVRQWPAESGTVFSDTDVESLSRVAVLGRTVVENLFDPGEDPVGAIVRIENVPFRVIGVLVAKGQSAEGGDQDDAVFIPFSTAERQVFGVQFFAGLVGAVLAATEREEDLGVAVDEIRRILRQRHRLGEEQPDDFTIRTQRDIAQVQEETSQTMMGMLLVAASVSLLVGGIGIMNILLVSITQRTREIGIRIAVGARRYHILMQFLSEALVLSFVGSLLGVIGGVVGARIVTRTAGWPTMIPLDAIAMAVLLSTGVGLFFGLYPAHKAARLNPIEALRYE